MSTIKVDASIPDGTRLGPWVLGPQLGSIGGQGTVYLAVHDDGWMSAVKIIHPEIWRSHQATFEFELKKAAELDHPNIIEVWDQFPILLGGRTTRAIVMERADETLEEWAQRERRSVADILDVGAQIASALEYLHDRRMTHNDIKPRNILRVRGVWKLADFGVATDLEGRSHKTQGIMDHDTVAPERLRLSRAVPAGDVYSLAVSLLWAYGQERVIWGKVTKTHTDGFPGRVRRVLVRAVDAEEVARPSAAKLVRRLHRYNRCPPVEPKGPEPEAVSTSSDRSPWRAAIAVALVLLVSAAGVGFWLEWLPDHRPDSVKEASGLSGEDTGPPEDGSPSSTVPTDPGTTTTQASPAPIVAPVDLTILNYCTCLGPRPGLGQVKVKPMLVNQRGAPYDLSGDLLHQRVALLMRDDQTGWSSPWSAQTGAPRTVTYNDETWWAIPPNPRERAEFVEEADGYTFATHWPDAAVLDPGASFSDPAVKEGDWVFYFAYDPNQTEFVFLIALFDESGAIIDVENVVDGVSTPPNAF